MKKKTYLTEQGLLETKKELEHLIKFRRKEIIQMLKDVRLPGDLLDNTEYLYVENELIHVEKRISKLEHIIKTAIIIKEISTNKVSIGSRVKLKFLTDNEIETYTIVGTYEADPFKNRISNESPIVQSILGKKVNDIATVVHRFGEYKVKILEIFA